MRSFVLLWPGTFADRRREDQNISFKKKTGVLFFYYLDIDWFMDPPKKKKKPMSFYQQ